MATHLAAFAIGPGKPFELRPRPTPQPGPNELLIAVNSIALNPADTLMRNTNMFIPSTSYPTVIGFDFSGLLLEVGSDVPESLFEAGVTRVAAYAAFWFKGCNPDYGAFQERVLVSWQHVASIGEKLSWNEAATLPVAIQVALNAWDVAGVPRMSLENDSSTASIVPPDKKEVLLMLGASSSVGTMGVQTARIYRDDPTSSFAAVYVAAGEANKDYILSLGADRVFDYNDAGVVTSIISAAKEEGLIIKHCFLAKGDLTLCQDVMQAFVSTKETKTAKIASAPPIPAEAKVVGGVESIFVYPSRDEEQRLEQFRYWIGTFLQDYLQRGGLRPSPEIGTVGKGLEKINEGLDMLERGVSCCKLVVDIEE